MRTQYSSVFGVHLVNPVNLSKLFYFAYLLVAIRLWSDEFCNAAFWPGSPAVACFGKADAVVIFAVKPLPGCAIVSGNTRTGSADRKPFTICPHYAGTKRQFIFQCLPGFAAVSCKCDGVA